MKNIVLLIVFIILGLFILCLATYFLVKDFNKNLKSKKLFETTLFVVYASLFATYTLALAAKLFPVLEPVGSADAWIGFAGSAMGGCITMLALYFTLKTTEERIQKSQIAALKPCIVCHITNLYPDRPEIWIKNCRNRFGFINCNMRNVSNNIANGIKIIDEYSSIQNEKGIFERNDNLENDFGISIFTDSITSGTFLAPQEFNIWKTNVYIETNADATYKWEGPSFIFKHTVVFSFSDISNTTTYKQRFEYVININIIEESKPRFFLEDVGNFMEPEDD